MKQRKPKPRGASKRTKAAKRKHAVAVRRSTTDTLNDYCYVIEISRFVHRTTGAMYSEHQFDKKFIGHISNASEAFFTSMRDPRIPRTVERLTYLPGSGEFPTDEHGLTGLNGYRPSTLRATSGPVRPWMDLVTHVFPDEDTRLHWLRFCAHLV